MSHSIVINDEWKEIADTKIVINNEWKDVSNIKVVVDNEWEEVYTSGIYTWDPDNTNSNVTLSNGDRTAIADSDGTDRTTISTWTKSTGKWYWEIEVTNGTAYQLAGVCDQSVGTNFTKDTRSGWNESWAHMGSVGRKYHDGAYVSYGVGWSIPAVLCFALDIDNHKWWIGVDNVWMVSGNPVNGTSPTHDDVTIDTEIAACFTHRYTNNVCISRFKASEQSYSPPSGFSAIDG